ncbi:MAG TPA: GAF domain-containing protein [Isosphaeraceae bacterium]|jgi:GAF domain-containing protein
MADVPPILSSASARLAARLELLRRADLLGPAAEPTFDRLCKFAARLLGAPVALMTVVDEDRQFFKGAYGLSEPWSSRRQTPLSHSICRHVADAGRPLVIADVRADPLVGRNPALAELGIRAYLGVPVTAPGGQILGSMCAIERTARSWSGDDSRTMHELATVASREIGLRLANADLRREAVGQRLLAQVATGLAAPLDEAVKLVRAASALVPELADRCSIDLVDEGRPGPRPRGDLGAPRPLLLGPSWERLRAGVMATGHPRLIPDRAGSVADLPDGDLARTLDAAGIRSLMIVPLAARGRPLGTMTLLSVESRRLFDGTDLALAVELAGSIAQLLRPGQPSTETIAPRASAETFTAAPGPMGTPDRDLNGSGRW